MKQLLPCDEVIVHENTILDLQILSLTFKHHPLFSEEHVLQQKLIDLYDTYREFTSQNKVQRLFKRIEALRSTKERLEKQAGDIINTDLIKEIAKLRECLFIEGKAEREVLKGVLLTWKAIKKVRQSNGYSNTSIKLVIRKEKVDLEQEKVVFDKYIKQTITEIIDDYNREFNEEMRVYKENLQLWKNLKDSGKEKPKKPQKSFKESELKQKVEEKVAESFKPPGEPKIHFEINYENEITNNVQDAREKLRRNCVNSTKIWLKIFCNDLEVCKTKRVGLNDKFVCVFEETCSIQLNSKKASISVEIMEQSGALLKRKSGEVILTLNHENKKYVMCEESFVKEEIVQYNKHSGVGSGVTFSELFSDINLSDTILNTSGFVLYNATWDFKKKTKNSFAQATDLKYFSDDIFDKHGMINVQKLIKWSENRNLDPEDPRNAILCDYLKNYSDKCFTNNNKFFRFEIL